MKTFLYYTGQTALKHNWRGIFFFSPSLTLKYHTPSLQQRHLSPPRGHLPPLALLWALRGLDTPKWSLHLRFHSRFLSSHSCCRTSPPDPWQTTCGSRKVNPRCFCIRPELTFGKSLTRPSYLQWGLQHSAGKTVHVEVNIIREERRM